MHFHGDAAELVRVPQQILVVVGRLRLAADRRDNLRRVVGTDAPHMQIADLVVGLSLDRGPHLGSERRGAASSPVTKRRLCRQWE